jgi:PAS domain S-box-containing protein
MAAIVSRFINNLPNVVYLPLNMSTTINNTVTGEQPTKEPAQLRHEVEEPDDFRSQEGQSETAVEEARMYAEAIIDTLREPLVVLDENLKVLSASRSFYETFRVTPGETVGHFIYHLGNGQWDIPQLRGLLEEIFKNTGLDNYEVDHTFPDIGRRFMLLNARRIYTEIAGTRMILLAIEDVTDLRQTDEALKTSEARYRRLFETAQDGILILNAETGQIDDVNPFLVHMLGYSYDEFVGKRLWEIGAFQDTEASKAAFAELQRKGYVRYEDLPLRTKDGRNIAVEFVSNVYAVNHQRVIQCNIRDITDRKRMEDKLQKAHDELEQRVKERTAALSDSNRLLIEEVAQRKRGEERVRESQERLRLLAASLQQIREQERASLSRELHDELGQVLTGMKMDLRWLGKRLQEGDEAISERINSLVTLIDNAILFVQRISRVLRPPVLDHLGLTEAIRSTAKRLVDRTEMAYKVISKPKDIVLERETSTAFFRVFQEALTNVIRHAQAKNVLVSLKRIGDRMIMEIGDDGRGIAKEEIEDPTSIGLTGMRERAFAVGGSLTITGVREKGTTVTLSVPLNHRERTKDHRLAAKARDGGD